MVVAGSRVFIDMALSPEMEVATLREQVAQLLADNTHLRAQLQEVFTLVGQLRGTIEKHQDHIAKLVKMTFGRKTERLEGPTLFDGPPEEPAAPLAPAARSEPEVLVPKRKGHGRKPNAANLPRRRELIDLSEAEKICPCCAGVRIRIGETIRERLDYTPSSIFVREMAQQTYACRSCEQAALPSQIVTADCPPEPVPRSGVGAGLLAQVIVSKCVDHLPLYRQEAIFARHGWPVSRTRLCDLVAACATLLDPVYRLMITRLKESFVIHVDESPVKLLQPRRTAYAWLYLGDAAHPYTVFDFTAGRGEEYPAAFVKGYSGFVQADGYTGYNLIHGSGVRHLGCWAHVRRKFVEALSNNPVKASEALAYIRTLYAVEAKILDDKLTGDKVVSLRQTRAGPILTKFGEWLEAEQRTALPKGPFGEALTYARNQWSTLGRYVNDARFAIDNNGVERALRPLAVGRKNWLFVGGDGGLSRAAVLMSLCVSAKRHGLNPWTYLADVLTQLAEKPSDVSNLLPDIWGQQQLPASP